jgi:agmatinase
MTHPVDPRPNPDPAGSPPEGGLTDPLSGFDPDAAAQWAGIYGLPHTPEQARVILIPVPWEATVSYSTGAAEGPAAVLQASRQVDLYDRDTGRPYQAGIAMLPSSPDIRNWNGRARALVAKGGAPQHAERIRGVDELSALKDEWVYRASREWLEQGKLVGVVGGDHSTPLGLMRALGRRHPGMGILHLDAHADLREAYEGYRWSHASIFWNVYHEIPEVERIVQVGVRDYATREAALIERSQGRIVTFFDSDIRVRLQDGEPWTRLAGQVIEELPREVYLSFDIDGLDPSLCPHTGTPVPGGLSLAEAVSLLRLIAASGRRIVGFDLCEVTPDPAGRSEWDGNVGARLLYKMIGFALGSQKQDAEH